MADERDTRYLHPAERELIQLDPKLRLNPVRSAENNFGSKSEWTVEQMEQNVLLTTVEKMTDWAAANSARPKIAGHTEFAAAQSVIFSTVVSSTFCSICSPYSSRSC